MPDHACVCAHAYLCPVVLLQGDLLRLQGQYGPGGVSGEQQIAAAAKDQQAGVTQHGVTEQLGQCGGIADFHQHRCGGAYAKGIARVQARVFGQAVGRRHGQA